MIIKFLFMASWECSDDGGDCEGETEEMGWHDVCSV